MGLKPTRFKIGDTMEYRGVRYVILHRVSMRCEHGGWEDAYCYVPLAGGQLAFVRSTTEVDAKYELVARGS